MIPCSYWASVCLAVLPSCMTSYVVSVRQVGGLPVVSLFPHPASFRSHLAVGTLAFGCILPTTGRIRDFHPLETCAARRTKEKPPETLISQRFRGSHPHRGDKIRTCGLRVPNAALYQTEPRLDLYLLLRTNRSKQMLSYLIFTEASSPVLRFYCFYCFSVCRTVLFVIASRRSVFCLITNAITPEST